MGSEFNPMSYLKQVAMLGGLTAVGFGGCLFHWLRRPRIENPNLHQDIWRAANERHKLYQMDALDPHKNGYLSPFFRPFWGVERDRVDGCSCERAIVSWISDEEWRADEYFHIPEFPSYRQSKARFEELIDELRSEVAKPAFVVPGDLLSRRHYMGTSNLRRLLHGIYKLAESRRYHDEDAEGALELLLLALSLFDKTGRGNSRIDWLYSRTSQCMTVETLTELIEPGDLKREKWMEVAAAARELLTPENDFVIALEDETAQLRVNTRRGLSPDEWGERFDPYERFESLRSRDERILCNEMTPLLLSVRNGGPPRYCRNRSHKGICVFTPGQFQLDTFQQSAYLCRRHLLGLLGAASLLGARDAKGYLPESIELEDGHWDHDACSLYFPFDPSKVTPAWLESQEAEEPLRWLQFRPGSGWYWKLG